MFIDMHMHESTFSKDSFLKLDEMVELAKERGLGAICITDHDDMGLKEYAKEYSEKTGFPIFVDNELFIVLGKKISEKPVFRFLWELNFFLCRGISWL